MLYVVDDLGLDVDITLRRGKPEAGYSTMSAMVLTVGPRVTDVPEETLIEFTRNGEIRVHAHLAKAMGLEFITIDAET